MVQPDSGYSSPPPPPWGSPPRPVGILSRRVLDQQMARSRQMDPKAWGAWPWLGPIVALIAVIIVGDVLAHSAVPAHGTGRTVAAVVIEIGGELVLLAALLAFGRGVSRREGGWTSSFGLAWIRGRDWQPWIIGIGLVFVGRIVVSAVANGATHGAAVRESANVRLTHAPSVLTIVVLALTLVVLAPVSEELMFRGLLLRTFMRRLAFWPAAALSSVAFGIFHVYEVTTLAGAVTLACTVAVLGFTNCYLVQITGRLTPGMMVHASFNALSLIVIVNQAPR